MSAGAKSKKNGPVYHVQPAKRGGWTIRSAGGRFIKEAPTKIKAVKEARLLMQQKGGRVVIDSATGQFVLRKRGAEARRPLSARAACDEIPADQADLFNAAAIAAARALAR